MTILALALVLGSALAHATWNYLAKSSRDKAVFTWSFVTLAAVIYMPIAAYFAILYPIPPQGWIFPLGTMLLHIAYWSLLGASYAQADLSAVYPVSRGTGIMLVPVVAALMLGERISPPGALSIAAILAGVAITYAGDRIGGHNFGPLCDISSRASRLAVLTGVVIAAYTTWDKQGVSVVNPLVYLLFPYLGQALVGIPNALQHRQTLQRELSHAKVAVLAAAILSPLAYLLVLFALTLSQASYVAASREIGIVIGALLGTVVLKEPGARNRIVGSSIIVAGVFGLALAG